MIQHISRKLLSTLFTCLGCLLVPVNAFYAIHHLTLTLAGNHDTAAMMRQLHLIVALLLFSIYSSPGLFSAVTCMLFKTHE